MAIKKSDMLYGAVIKRIISGINKEITIENYPTKTNNTVLINKKIALYMKYSTKEGTPWRFTLTKENQEDLHTLNEIFEYSFLILVCYIDGVVSLAYKDLKIILDEHYDEFEWISAARSKKESYQLSGSNGKLDFKVSDSDLLSNITSLV